MHKLKASLARASEDHRQLEEKVEKDVKAIRADFSIKATFSDSDALRKHVDERIQALREEVGIKLSLSDTASLSRSVDGRIMGFQNEVQGRFNSFVVDVQGRFDAFVRDALMDYGQVRELVGKMQGDMQRHDDRCKKLHETVAEVQANLMEMRVDVDELLAASAGAKDKDNKAAVAAVPVQETPPKPAEPTTGGGGGGGGWANVVRSSWAGKQAAAVPQTQQESTDAASSSKLLHKKVDYLSSRMEAIAMQVSDCMDKETTAGLSRRDWTSSRSRWRAWTSSLPSSRWM